MWIIDNLNLVGQTRGTKSQENNSEGIRRKQNDARLLECVVACKKGGFNPSTPEGLLVTPREHMLFDLL